MSIPHPGKTMAAIMLLFAAVGVAAALYLGWTAGNAGAQTETATGPRLIADNPIAIANGGQTGNDYLGAGDKIYFNVYLTKQPEPVIANAGLESGNHFHFRYHNGAGSQAYKAVLKGTGSETRTKQVAETEWNEDGSTSTVMRSRNYTQYYLAYEHEIPQGVLSNDSRKLYFAASPAPAATSAVCHQTESGSCEPFVFDALADNAELSGTVQVAAGGNPASFGRTPPARLASQIADAQIISESRGGDGWYTPGERIVIRTYFNGRVAGMPAEDMSYVHLMIGIASGVLYGDSKETVLIGLGNHGTQGYADWEYTVQPNDVDTSGIHIAGTRTRNNRGICPESLGNGCPADQQPRFNYPRNDVQMTKARIAPELRVQPRPGQSSYHNFTVGQTVPPDYPQSRFSYGKIIGSIQGHLWEDGYHGWSEVSPDLPAGLRVNFNGFLNTSVPHIEIVGTPATATPAADYTITQADRTGRQSSMTFRLTVNPAATNLDADGDGLIEVRTPEQFLLMAHDTDGDGNVSGLPSNDYYGAEGFFNIYAGTGTAPTGCPSTGCIGYELMQDIDLTGKNLGNGLGAYESQWQTVFDGNGHKITGLDITGTSNREAGLFEYIGPSGTVRNLGVKSAQVRGETNIGVIAGVNLGTIDNVYVEDSTAAAAYNIAGLIAGQNGSPRDAGARIRNFWATGEVSVVQGGSGSAVGMNYGIVNYGWTDAFTDAKIPLGNAHLGYSIIAGYNQLPGNTQFVSELHSTADTAAVSATRSKVVTEAELEKASKTVGDTARTWPAAVWDFGDNCQKPVLKSGGHTPARQAATQGPACAPASP